MADYHPLILRAVEGLEKNTGENRRALYERARIALVAQLRGVQPALDESEITRERLGLREVDRRLVPDHARHQAVGGGATAFGARGLGGGGTSATVRPTSPIARNLR